ncbi:MAG: solute carrier family 23 protein, partial [Lachnospiraceae bacterium]
LIGMTAGYVISIPLGLVSFDGVKEAGWFALPKLFAFGIEFHASTIITFLLLYFIVGVQMIGDFSVSSMGGMNREPTDEELSGGIIGNGITSALSAIINSFPSATYSQNSGIVALTKVCSKYVIAVGTSILIIAGLCPKVGAVLSTIPNSVIGGGTLVVFSMIATSGMKLMASAGLSNRNCLVIGVSLAFGLGTQFCKGASSGFPTEIATMLESNSVILTSIMAILLNSIFPKDKEETVQNNRQ